MDKGIGAILCANLYGTTVVLIPPSLVGMFTKLIFLATLLVNTAALHLRGSSSSDNIPYIVRHSLQQPFRPSLSQISYYNLTREVDVQQSSLSLTENTDSLSPYYQ